MKKSKTPNVSEAEFLKSYDASKFERPSVTVDMVIFAIMDCEQENYRKLPEKELKVLLVKRGGHPFLGMWALPGGFVRPNENLDQAAERELHEETGVSNVYMEQLYTWGDLGRDPRTRVISCSYMALIDGSKVQLVAGDDATDAKWFTVTKRLKQETRTVTKKGSTQKQRFVLTLKSDAMETETELEKTIARTVKQAREEERIVTPGKLAFDHSRMVGYALDRLRNKIEYSDIAFHLMPELFTLTQLQQVYETVLDRELLKANFRRKIEGKLIETEHFTDTSGHRPSRLFKMKSEE